jgi:hydrogenase nickel incorporation protein HypA/HybF
MHELSIAVSILEIAEEESEQRGNTPVEAIHLKLGLLSGIVKDALNSAFELAVEQSAFPKCRLIIEEIPASRELQISALELAE